VLRWEVAETAAFGALVASGAVGAPAAADYTAVVDVPGLAANKEYYYRFRNERTAAASVVGETKTLPTGAQASSVKLAVVSCANFQAGLFNVYGAVAASDADAVVHFGDYSYEHGMGQYGPTPALLGQYNALATQLAGIKLRILANDPGVTAAERAPSSPARPSPRPALRRCWPATPPPSRASSSRTSSSSTTCSTSTPPSAATSWPRSRPQAPPPSTATWPRSTRKMPPPPTKRW